MGSLRECGGCRVCGAPSCGNRQTQRGVAVRLRVVRHLHKGFGAARRGCSGSGLHSSGKIYAIIMNIMVYLEQNLLHQSNLLALLLVSICSLLGFCVSYDSLVYIINLFN